MVSSIPWRAELMEAMVVLVHQCRSSGGAGILSQLLHIHLHQPLPQPLPAVHHHQSTSTSTTTSPPPVHHHQSTSTSTTSSPPPPVHNHLNHHQSTTSPPPPPPLPPPPAVHLHLHFHLHHRRRRRWSPSVLTAWLSAEIYYRMEILSLPSALFVRHYRQRCLIAAHNYPAVIRGGAGRGGRRTVNGSGIPRGGGCPGRFSRVKPTFWWKLRSWASQRLGTSTGRRKNVLTLCSALKRRLLKMDVRHSTFDTRHASTS